MTVGIMNRFLTLRDRSPLNQGNSRLVYEHPDDPAFVVKVIRPDVVEERFGSGTAWYKRRRRYGRYLSYIRELQEYIAVYASHGRELPFLQKVIGLVETDLGLGLITEAARDADGGLAPSIATLIESGRFDSTVRRDLDAFLRQIVDCDVIISDMNMGNLVYAHRKPAGNQFVQIDGLGNSNMFPFKALSRRMNRRSKYRRYERLYRRIAVRLEKFGHPMPPFPQQEL